MLQEAASRQSMPPTSVRSLARTCLRQASASQSCVMNYLFHLVLFWQTLARAQVFANSSLNEPMRREAVHSLGSLAGFPFRLVKPSRPPNSSLAKKSTQNCVSALCQPWILSRSKNLQKNTISFNKRDPLVNTSHSQLDLATRCSISPSFFQVSCILTAYAIALIVVGESLPRNTKRIAFVAVA